MLNNGVSSYRPRGRAHSPPTWAWYEQLQPEDLESGSEYCSDSAVEDVDERDYNEDEYGSEEDERSDDGEGRLMTQEENDSEEMRSVEANLTRTTEESGPFTTSGTANLKDEDGTDDEQTAPRLTSEMKGKQKAVEPPKEELVPAQPRKTRRKRKAIPISATKPILTIKSSQGFVWNQDLFIPSYIKDRYYMSTSPPNPTHAIPMLASSCDTLNDYDLDVVEIRVSGNELNRFRS